MNTGRRKYNCCLVRLSNENSLLDFPAFVHIMGVNQGISCALFSGAGAYVSSGVSFAWLSLSRRLSKDYERLPETGEAMIYGAMSRLMLRRLVRAA